MEEMATQPTSPRPGFDKGGYGLMSITAQPCLLCAHDLAQGHWPFR